MAPSSMLYKVVAILGLCACALGARDLKSTSSILELAAAPAPGALKWGGFGWGGGWHPYYNQGNQNSVIQNGGGGYYGGNQNAVIQNGGGGGGNQNAVIQNGGGGGNQNAVIQNQGSNNQNAVIQNGKK